MSGPIVGYFPPGSGAPGHAILFLSFVSQLRGAPPPVVQALEGGSASWHDTSAFIVAMLPSLEDVVIARRHLGRLMASGVAREHIFTVLMCSGIPGGMSASVIEKEIGPLSSRWPYDVGLQMAAENNGQLITQAKPKAPLARAITTFAELISRHLANPTHATETNVTMDDRAAEARVISGLWRELQEVDDVKKTSETWLTDRIDQELERLFVQGERLDPAHLDNLRRRIRDHVLGYGPLEKLMADAALNEIMVNGCEIFIEKNGVLSRHTEIFESEAQLRIVIDRMVGRGGRRVDLSSPMCDVRLPDGSRVNVILPPLSLSGPVVTIRRFRAGYQTMTDLVRAGTLSDEEATFLQHAVRSRENILIAGNTGSGKTTLLNVLSRDCAPSERIITLEDTAELSLQQRHVVRLETRPRNTEGAGEVRMDDLLVNALRMRPDRLIIGECRGGEVVPMLQAMNTGHDGSMTTVHANSATDAMSRLESMVALAAPSWSMNFVREQIAAGLDLVIYLKRAGATRTLEEMARVEFRNGHLQLVPV